MPSFRTFPHLVSVLGLLLVTSCGEQAEGERCERSNDSNDCAAGLVCKSLQDLTGASVGAVCCPESNPTTAICHPQNLNLDTGDDEEPEPAPAADAGG